MNTILLFITLQLASPLQTSFDATDFSTKFKKLFEAGKTYYKAEKTGTGRAITDGIYVKEFDCVTKFTGATVSRIVEDGDKVCAHQVHYAVADKDAATKLAAEIEKLMQAGVPATFKKGTTYDARYTTSQATYFEFDSETIAQVYTKPSARMGILLKDGKYYVEVLIIENIFRR